MLHPAVIYVARKEIGTTGLKFSLRCCALSRVRAAQSPSSGQYTGNVSLYHYIRHGDGPPKNNLEHPARKMNSQALGGLTRSLGPHNCGSPSKRPFAATGGCPKQACGRFVSETCLLVRSRHRGGEPGACSTIVILNATGEMARSSGAAGHVKTNNVSILRRFSPCIDRSRHTSLSLHLNCRTFSHTAHD